MLPRLFIGSSAESEEAAKALKKQLASLAEPRLWSQDVFNPTDFTLEALIRESKGCDLAVLLFTPDDLATIRSAKRNAVRDNVVLEYGLFTGALGRERCYFVMPERAPNLRVPSDLSGVNALTYSQDTFKVDQTAAFRSVAEKLKKSIAQHVTGGGVRRALTGTWSQCWQVQGSNNFPLENRSPAEVLQVGDAVRGEWRSGSDSYVMEARMADRLLTGTWRTKLAGGGYSGAFQLVISASGTTMTGKWIGHREAMSVESGEWTWQRT